MRATEILKHEHQVILAVMDAAERELRSIHVTGKITTDNVEKIIDFGRIFIESCHNAKEEEYLLPKMQERGDVGNIGLFKAIVDEHAEGRRLLQLAARDLTPAKTCAYPSFVANVTSNLKAYVQLLRTHIDKEDRVLFPLADRLFSPDDQKTILESFDKHEKEEVGLGVHEKYLQLAHELGQA